MRVRVWVTMDAVVWGTGLVWYIPSTACALATKPKQSVSRLLFTTDDPSALASSDGAAGTPAASLPLVLVLPMPSPLSRALAAPSRTTPRIPRMPPTPSASPALPSPAPRVAPATTSTPSRAPPHAGALAATAPQLGPLPGTRAGPASPLPPSSVTVPSSAPRPPPSHSTTYHHCVRRGALDNTHGKPLKLLAWHAHRSVL